MRSGKMERKVYCKAHCIISAARLKSFTSVVRFEVSSIMSSPLEISDNCLLFQFVWDNADFNTQTLDEDNDGEPILSDDLVEASLSLHVEEDTDVAPEDIRP
ncbi:hypothetical protein AVEN_22689-1 [Araneus ventricosus]|uniref:Uncharacterized protein n=1 Tax=Araneus ventricosus TaxID=182803 RepID=A0A4Y2WH38_ARAVE|nr:hypothetical protein AVEN_22689-1 [Araneus ventricosus]